MDRALRFLAQRPRSEREVRRRLAERGVDPEQIEGAIVRLRELSLLDDRAFAAYWLENRAQFKPRGQRALRAELFQKGVARVVVDEALAAEPRDEAEAAYQAAEKRARQLSTLDERTFRQRLSQFLARRGFGWDAIEPTLHRLWADRGLS